jgi:hypothetical protein
MSKEWYHSILVPSSLSLSSKNNVKVPTNEDKEGPAIELIGLVSIAVAQEILLIGLSHTNFTKSIKQSATTMNDDDKDDKDHVIVNLRASEHCQLTLSPNFGWSKYVNGMHQLSSDAKRSPLPSCVNELFLFSGNQAFSPELPFKSMSLSLNDYFYFHKFMEQLYVSATEFSNMKSSGRNGLKNREDLEILAGKYAEEMKCDF